MAYKTSSSKSGAREIKQQLNPQSPEQSAQAAAESIPVLSRKPARRLGRLAVSAVEADRKPLHIAHEAPEESPDYYRSFARPDLPGYSETEINADLAFYERLKSAQDARTAKQREESGRIYDAEKARLTEETIISDLKKIIPPTYALEIFPTSDIDDRLNHVDFVVQLEQPGEEPVFFAVDSTYNKSTEKITKKLTASSCPGKATLKPGEARFAHPEVSEFAVTLKNPDGSRNPEFDRSTPRSHGFANLKYIKDTNGEPLRLQALPKMILGIADSEIPSLETSSMNNSGEKIDTIKRRERLLYELVSQAEQIYRGAYDSLTSDLDKRGGIITESYISKAAVEHSQRLMNILMDIDEQHAARAESDPAMKDARATVCDDSPTAPYSNAISNTIISLSEDLVAGRQRYISRH